MSSTAILGCLAVAIGGLFMGAGAWPFKLMRKYQFEHWWLAGVLFGLFVLPWTITLVFCPDAFGGIRSAWASNSNDIVLANVLSTAWGVANVLCGLCFVRIGVALTGAILAGIGVSVAVMTPLFLRSAGMGKFGEAPHLFTPAGMLILAGLVVILVGVVLVALAGFGRDRALKKEQQQTHGSFSGGLVMTIIAGVLSAGLGLSFVYSHDPIVNAMKANGAQEFPASISVWALGIIGGLLVNVIYPVYLLTRNRSWGVFAASWRELLLCLVIGLDTIVAISLAGYGMILIGTLGAAVGIAVQQACQIMGNQGLGFISGEWREVYGKPRMQMYAAIVTLLVGAAVMAYCSKLV